MSKTSKYLYNQQVSKTSNYFVQSSEMSSFRNSRPRCKYTSSVWAPMETLQQKRQLLLFSTHPGKSASEWKSWWACRSSACKETERNVMTVIRDSSPGRPSAGRHLRRGNTAWQCQGPCPRLRTAWATCSQEHLHLALCPSKSINQLINGLLFNKEKTIIIKSQKIAID